MMEVIFDHLKALKSQELQVPKFTKPLALKPVMQDFLHPPYLLP